jgi:glycosyltransferase involved in cell wall biosynthesis
VSEIGGLAEVAASRAAQAVPPDDAAALADAVRTLVESPEQRSALAGAARDAADGPYSWDVAATRTIELYGSLL